LIVLVVARKESGKSVAELKKDISALSADELVSMRAHVQEALQTKQQQSSHIPVSIFATELSPAEAVVKYLKEHHALTFSEIARLINRDQRGIWGAYARTQRKRPAPFDIKETACEIPISILTDRSRSILEHIVTYLKDERKFSPSHICALLNKKPSTIWTAYQRSRRKLQ
jgi:DNA-directed RNA polymerase specialized sigma24 family protein